MLLKNSDLHLLRAFNFSASYTSSFLEILSFPDNWWLVVTYDLTVIRSKNGVSVRTKKVCRENPNVYKGKTPVPAINSIRALKSKTGIAFGQEHQA